MMNALRAGSSRRESRAARQSGANVNGFDQSSALMYVDLYSL